MFIHKAENNTTTETETMPWEDGVLFPNFKDDDLPF